MSLNRKGELSRNLFRWTILLFTSIAPFLIVSSRLAAQSTGGETPRRIKSEVKPEYPALARRLNLSGVVRVEVQIEPNGKVKRARVIGGNPVLAVEAEKAAMLTEFEPAAKESMQIIEFRFNPAG